MAGWGRYVRGKGGQYQAVDKGYFHCLFIGVFDEPGPSRPGGWGRSLHCRGNPSPGSETAGDPVGGGPAQLPPYAQRGRPGFKFAAILG